PAVKEEKRGKRRVEVGVVTSDKMNKTRRGGIPRLGKHQRHGKDIKRRTICPLPDEQNEAHVGDTGEIKGARPPVETQRRRRGPGVRVVTGARTAAPAPPPPTPEQTGTPP